MPIVNMPIQVTQEMLDLYSKGLVSLGPGGFKNLSGRMVQLLKPIAMSGSSAASGALAGAQIGLEVVELGASAANMVISVKNGKKINRILNTMMTLKSIAWAGTAVGTVNLVLNVAGMARLSRKIDGLSMRLDQIAAEIKQEMRKIQTEERIRETNTLIDNFVSVINILENSKLGSSYDITIQDYLNTGKSYINWWVERYKKSRNAESNAIFTLLYDLTAMYSAVVKEYGAQYYYNYGIYPGSYDNWVQPFEYIDDKEFEKRLKRTIWLANPVASTERLVDAYDFTLNSIRLQALDLKEYKEVVPFMPKEAHFDFDAFIKDKIKKGEVEIVEKAENEDPREEVLLQQNGYAAV